MATKKEAAAELKEKKITRRKTLRDVRAAIAGKAA